MILLRKIQCLPSMTESCDDYAGYKKQKDKGFEWICGEIVWKEDKQMKDMLDCYDKAHSKSKCVTEKYKENVEEFLQSYIENGPKPLCKEIKAGVLDCIKVEGSITACEREMSDFIECLGTTVQQITQNECEKQKNR